MEIGAGAEVLTLRTENNCPARFRLVEPLHPLGQVGDQLLIEEVVRTSLDLDRGDKVIALAHFHVAETLSRAHDLPPLS